MHKRVATRPVVGALFGIVAVLAALNWHIFQSTVEISPIAPPHDQVEVPLSSSIDLVTPLDGKAAAQFGQMVERPLFNPNRKPIKREIPVGTGRDTNPGDLKLIGVMKVGDQPSRALIRSASTQTGKWLAEGEEFDGWTLLKVGARSVTVGSAGQLHELALAAPRREADDEPHSELSKRR
jgi:hypothetical protein